MNKINRAMTKGLFVAVAAIGVANIFDAIYAGVIVDAATSNITMAATINPSMTMEISNSSPELTITPSSEGTFGSVSFSVATYSNGSIGYSVIMTPSSLALAGTQDDNHYISTFSSGSYTPSSFPTGYWGVSVNNSNFEPAGTKTIITVADTTTGVSSGNTTISLGAKLDLSTPTDIYTTTLNFAATPTIKSYPVTFTFDSHIRNVVIKDSTGTNVIGTVYESGNTIDLYYANSYTIVPTYHNGYVSDGMTLTGAGILSENSIFGVGAGSSTIALASTEHYYMQNLSPLVLDSLMPNAGDTKTVYDKRDESSYTIAKLADGKYWMLDNLALDLTSSTVKSNLNSNTTNATDTALGYLKNGGGSSPYAAAAVTKKPEAVIEDASDEFLSFTDPQINTSSKDITVTKFGNDGSGKVGIYYNVCAASAGSRCGYLFTDISQDICPAGWHIPSGNTAGSDYGTLLAEYNSNAGFRSAFSASLSGYFSVDNTFDQDSTGYWLSSTAVGDINNSDYGIYGLVVIGSGNVYADNPQTPEDGYPIRCVTEGALNIQALEYMQDFNFLDSSQQAPILNSMTTGTQYKLYDSRDQKGYYVSKLADGNVWMTQNLDLDLDSDTTYTPDDTDILDDWTPSTSTHATGDTTWTSTTSTPQSYDPGNICWNGVVDMDWETTLSNGTTTCNDGANTNYHIGNYYNWTAAIAMTDSSSVTSGSVDQSICPAGWTLPKGGSNTGSGSFQGLLVAYGWSDSNNKMSGAREAWDSPLYFPLSGSWEGQPGGGRSFSVGSGGYYQSSTAYNVEIAHFTGLEYDSYANPNNGGERSTGLSVRCVLR